jgi:hypothetical protein
MHVTRTFLRSQTQPGVVELRYYVPKNGISTKQWMDFMLNAAFEMSAVSADRVDPRDLRLGGNRYGAHLYVVVTVMSMAHLKANGWREAAK